MRAWEHENRWRVSLLGENLGGIWRDGYEYDMYVGERERLVELTFRFRGIGDRFGASQARMVQNSVRDQVYEKEGGIRFLINAESSAVPTPDRELGTKFKARPSGARTRWNH